MTAEVLEFNGITCLDIPAERALRKAQEAGLKGCVVIGCHEDGTEYFASTFADGGDVIWYLERAKLKLLRLADDE